MEKLSYKLETFQQEIAKRVFDLIETQGVESKHSSTIVLKIEDEEFMYNLDGYPTGSYVEEISPTHLISNFGHTYSHDHVEIETLCLMIDSFNL